MFIPHIWLTADAVRDETYRLNTNDFRLTTYCLFRYAGRVGRVYVAINQPVR